MQSFKKYFNKIGDLLLQPVYQMYDVLWPKFPMNTSPSTKRFPMLLVFLNTVVIKRNNNKKKILPLTPQVSNYDSKPEETTDW